MCRENLMAMVFYKWWRAYNFSQDMQTLERVVTVAVNRPANQLIGTVIFDPRLYCTVKKWRRDRASECGERGLNSDFYS